MNKWMKTGLVGTTVTALCCFTPILVWLFAALGIGGLVVYLDMILIPLLGVFIIILLWGVVNQTLPNR